MMKMTWLRRVRRTALLVGLTGLCGCANGSPPPVVVGSVAATPLTGLVAQQRAVFLLAPCLTYSDVATERSLPPEASGGAEARQAMTEEVVAGLQALGFRVVATDSLPADARPAVRDLVARLQEECGVLVSRYKDKQPLLPTLQRLAELTGTTGACLEALTVKVGARATYDPNSGSMAMGSSTSAAKVALLSLADGHPLWQNECFLRELPSGARFRKTVREMFEPESPRR